MSAHSKIEWTDATWNPITGCSVVSPGCTNCYAMKLAGTRLAHHPSRAGLTTPSKAGPVWNGRVRFNREWLNQPLRWNRPRRIFVCAHGDLFHESVPNDWIDEVFAVMAVCPEHTFQVLTKRSKRMREYMTERWQCTPAQTVLGVTVPDGKPTGRCRAMQWTQPLPNVHLGVSVEDHRRAEERIPNLLATPAALRFISAEPLLGPVDVRPWLGTAPRLDWVIAGGESGKDARPSHPDWFRNLRDQCRAASVPLFFKQWGEWAPCGDGEWHGLALAGKPEQVAIDRQGLTSGGLGFIGQPFSARMEIEGWVGTQRIGKARAGARLDGREYREFPRGHAP